MENSKQIQKAGDGSRQVQMINPTIVMGIDEKRVREVCSEISVETIKQCTQEASAIAIARIEKFTTDLIPRVERVILNHFLTLLFNLNFVMPRKSPHVQIEMVIMNCYQNC